MKNREEWGRNRVPMIKRKQDTDEPHPIWYPDITS